MGSYGLNELKQEMSENLDNAILYSVQKDDSYENFDEYEKDMQSFKFSDVFGRKE